MSARQWAALVAIALGTAALVHAATLAYVPRLVMNSVMAKMGAPNTMHHAPRATAASHGVVRPSPDLLYSSCPFDLSAGPLHVHAPVPPGTYWSVSAYDDTTNNFFALNDRQAGAGAVDLLIVSQGESRPAAAGGMRIAASPSKTGVVLLRTLINDEKRFAAIDRARRQATCETISGSGASKSGG